MTTFHHTPGPWTLGDENNQCCDVELGVQYNLTCSLNRQDANTGEVVISRGEMLANARLITTSPDLLDALRDLYGQVLQAKEGFGVYASSPSMDESIRNAEIAIAKATGTQL